MVTDLSAQQCSNAINPIFVTDAGILMDCKELQPPNMEDGISDKLLLIVQLVKFLLLEITPPPRSVQELGTVNVDRLQLEKAAEPIFVRLSFTVSLFKAVQW